MATITTNTPWKTTGDTTIEALRAEFSNHGIHGRRSPLVTHVEAIHQAASPYTRLLAAMSWVEQKHATYIESPIPADYHNFLSLSAAWDPSINGHTWRRFASYADCARAWRERFEAPDGPYPPHGSVGDLIAVYAPPGENRTINTFMMRSRS